MDISKRYMTAGIAREIEPLIQLMLWKLLDDKIKANASLDYLQVFTLSTFYVSGQTVFKIIHRQEVPPAHDEWYFTGLGLFINTTIWVIDSGESATMLFPHEY